MVEGSTPQISLAYSAMVLSLENLPDEAMFIAHFSNHKAGFWKNKTTQINLLLGLSRNDSLEKCVYVVWCVRWNVCMGCMIARDHEKAVYYQN